MLEGYIEDPETSVFHVLTVGPFGASESAPNTYRLGRFRNERADSEAKQVSQPRKIATMALPALPGINVSSVRDNMRGSQYMPYELTGNHRLAVLDYKFVPKSKENQNRSKFIAKVKIIDSDNANAIGRMYLLNFKTEREGESQDYADRDRTAFVASCTGLDLEFLKAEDEVKAGQAFIDAQQALVDAAAGGKLEPGEDGAYPVQIFHTRTSKKKEGANSVENIKKGEPALVTRVYANDYYSPTNS
jgi:hypothetical protein